MRYVSIDIETTGLDPKVDQILEIGAIVKELGSDGMEDSFHMLVRHSHITGSARALSMHSELLIECDLNGLSLSTVKGRFWSWLNKWRGGSSKITPAGKNFARFDLPFLLRAGLPSNLFHRRVLDPAILCMRADDVVPPSLPECLKRMGLKPSTSVEHRAMGDAMDVIQVIEEGYRRLNQ